MIPFSFSEITKSFIFIEIPYCELNEIKWRHILKKFHKFTSNSFRMVIMWKNRNIRSLFLLKDYKSCVIYKEDCSQKRNAEKLDGTSIIIQLTIQNH